MNKIYQQHTDVTPIDSANPTYNQTRPYADKYLAAQIQILADAADISVDQVSVAPDSLDIHEGTDLILTLSDGFQVRVAARVRAPGYFGLYSTEFTLRTKVISGSKTEYDKIMAGHGDLMLYGHASSMVPDKIEHWVLIDLDVFRFAVLSGIQSKNKSNRDGSAFKAFDMDQLPEKLVITSNFYSWRD